MIEQPYAKAAAAGMTAAGVNAVKTTLAALALTACAALPVSAQNDVTRAPADNPLRSLSRTLKMTPEPATPPDWVVKTRPPEQDTNYIPTGAAARNQPAQPLSLERVREIERALDAERVRHDRLSGRAAAPAARRSVAIGPVAKKKSAKRKCVLTCAPVTIGIQKKR